MSKAMKLQPDRTAEHRNSAVLPATPKMRNVCAAGMTPRKETMSAAARSDTTRNSVPHGAPSRHTQRKPISLETVSGVGPSRKAQDVESA